MENNLEKGRIRAEDRKLYRRWAFAICLDREEEVRIVIEANGFNMGRNIMIPMMFSNPWARATCFAALPLPMLAKNAVMHVPRLLPRIMGMAVFKFIKLL